MTESALDFHRPAWMVRAACRDVPREVFYPEGGMNGAYVYREAKAFCDGCEVRAECLTWALDYEGPSGKERRHGMFGGLTPRQRADLRRPRVCVICEAEYMHDRDRPTCSERCAKVRDARYHSEWSRSNRWQGMHGRHGSNAMANSGCPCAVCRNHRRARAREQRVSKAMRERGAA